MMDFILGGVSAYIVCGAFIVSKVAASAWRKSPHRETPSAFVVAAFLAVVLWPRLISEEVV